MSWNLIINLFILNIPFIITVLVIFLINSNEIGEILFSLISIFFCYIYFLIYLGCDFLGWACLIIYLGAVMVFFIFIIMTLNFSFLKNLSSSFFYDNFYKKQIFIYLLILTIILLNIIPIFSFFCSSNFDNLNIYLFFELSNYNLNTYYESKYFHKNLVYITKDFFNDWGFFFWNFFFSKNFFMNFFNIEFLNEYSQIFLTKQIINIPFIEISLYNLKFLNNLEILGFILYNYQFYNLIFFSLILVSSLIGSFLLTESFKN